MAGSVCQVAALAEIRDEGRPSRLPALLRARLPAVRLDLQERLQEPLLRELPREWLRRWQRYASLRPQISHSSTRVASVRWTKRVCPTRLNGQRSTAAAREAMRRRSSIPKPAMCTTARD